MFFTIPTLLTWARIVAIPLIVGVFYLPVAPATRNLAATVLFVVVALTDWLDGYLARRLNQTSAFGAFLDPVADKFLVCASLLILVQMDRVNALVAWSSSAARSPSRPCASGWPRSALRAAWPCT
jgi:CDP-diacylglycerol--glycerol-3-phosphate 3-phosphatidyltransferase